MGQRCRGEVLPPCRARREPIFPKEKQLHGFCSEAEKACFYRTSATIGFDFDLLMWARLARSEARTGAHAPVVICC